MNVSITLHFLYFGHTREIQEIPKTTKHQLLYVQPLVLQPTLFSLMINQESVLFFLIISHMMDDINTHDIFS